MALSYFRSFQEWVNKAETWTTKEHILVDASTDLGAS